MNMIFNILYKCFLNVPSVFRGFFSICKFSLFKDVSIQWGMRVGKSVDLRLYPGAICHIGANLKFDKYAQIAVIPDANLNIGSNVGIGMHNVIICRKKISIGDNTILGQDVKIYDHNHKFDFETGVSRLCYDEADVQIGCNCWIGAGAIILKGVHIGDNTIVAAVSVVTKDIPSKSIVAGVPARIIKQH